MNTRIKCVASFHWFFSRPTAWQPMAAGCLALLAMPGLGCTSSSASSADASATAEAGDGGGGGGGGGGGQAAVPESGAASVVHIDRSHLTDAGTTGRLDYSDPALWVCRPGIDPNPCYGNMDATELLPDGGRQVVVHQRATNPQFDCFYVYPTVLLTSNANMTDFSDITIVLDPLLAQAGRFSEICEIYAPLYRQLSFTPGDAGAVMGDGGLASNPREALALQDVRDAFQYYLQHFNQGRKFVLMGHSQGSVMLTSMMQMDVDPMPIRAQLLSALLLGGGETVAPGRTAGGTFQNIPTCTVPGQTGCMIAYSTYDVKSPPPANALFGKSPDGNEVACTEPGALALETGPYQGTVFPLTVNNPLLKPDMPPPQDVGTPFVLYRGVFQGNCVMKNGYSYLEITLLEQPGDPRGVPPYKNSGAESLGFGTHIADYGFALGELIEAVSKQAGLPPR
jgi:hypothetical protein